MNVKLERLVLSFKESLAMALTSVKTNRTRSSLTLLGIAVGVFSIIGVMTAMNALIHGIEEGMSELGANTFQVQKQQNFFGGNSADRAKYRNRKNISFQQALAVKDRATLAGTVGIESWTGGKMLKAGAFKTNPNVDVSGENVEGFTTNDWTVDEGRMFTEQEYEAGKNVTLITKKVAEKLFPHGSPIGGTVEMDGQIYEVLGTIADKGSIFGGENDYFMVIPVTALYRMYGTDRDTHIMVQAKDALTLPDCLEQVRGILRAERNVTPGADDDFYIFSNDSLIDQFNDLTQYVRLGVMIISAIALLAAGVGIMNIMLVSVTERTREIGIRKAIGATKRNVLSQFVFEAVLLSEIGGLIGIVVGVILGNVAAMLLHVPPDIPWDWVAIGFLSCSFVGLVFGVYPAWKASNLDPIDALRYE
jgi:putative ABC transport system permease protein